MVDSALETRLARQSYITALFWQGLRQRQISQFVCYERMMRLSLQVWFRNYVLNGGCRWVINIDHEIAAYIISEGIHIGQRVEALDAGRWTSRKEPMGLHVQVKYLKPNDVKVILPL